MTTHGRSTATRSEVVQIRRPPTSTTSGGTRGPATFGRAEADRARAQFPALRADLVLLDGPGGTQMPRPVSEAVMEAMITPVSNQGGAYGASRRADEIVDEARAAVADLVGGEARGVVFGPSMTALTYRFAQTLSASWDGGDNVVVSRLDHDADVRPWVQAAARCDVEVRWAQIDPATCELPVDQYESLIDERTRLVAVTGASNVAGTRPNVRAIAERAHRAGALVYVDGVHLTAHAPVDMRALGADFYATSSYKWCGPHLAAVIADPALLETLDQDKLLPASSAVPCRFEWGTLPFEALAGIAPAVEFIAALADGPPSLTRRERILTSMAALERYEEDLALTMRAGVRSLGGTIVGSAATRTPTVAFLLPGFDNRAVAERLGDAGVCIGDGNFYALELVRSLGIDAEAGVLRAGLAPYNTADDIARLLDELERVTGS